MQVILGAGGSIGRELARELKKYTSQIRLVSRTPEKVNPDDELFPATLLDKQQVMKAVEGAKVAYLTVGLPYSLKIWREQWPVMMQNVLDACAHHKVKLVFFDNIYLYDGSNLNPIKETNPVNPPSEKGKVRAAIAGMLWKAVESGKVEALIARAADFYGPQMEKSSVLCETIVAPLLAGKAANVLVGDNFKHSYTHTAEAAKATALLGNTPEAYSQVWHLPTAKNPLTGKEMVELVAREIGVAPKYRVVSKTMIKMMGWLMPIMKEMHEMLYQNDKDYVFNSDKFEEKFGMHPRSYEEGIRELVRNSLKQRS